MIFDPVNVQTSIDAVLKQAGAPSATKAFILTGEAGPDGGVQAVYVQKIGHGWTVQGEFDVKVTKQVAAGVRVVWTD
jgi:anti-sigma factor RsiW